MTTLNEITYVDWQYKLNKIGSVAEGVEDINQCIAIILSKQKGTIKDFYSNIIPIGKLAQANVKGGIYLKSCLFQIHIPDYIKLQYGVDDINNSDIYSLII